MIKTCAFLILFFLAAGSVIAAPPQKNAAAKHAMAREQSYRVMIAASNSAHYRIVGNVEKLEEISSRPSGPTDLMLSSLCGARTTSTAAVRGAVSATGEHLEALRREYPDASNGRRIIIFEGGQMRFLKNGVLGVAGWPKSWEKNDYLLAVKVR